MKSNDKPRELTELEGAALGVIVRDGPCTAYAVKELFRASASEFWSGSAGSIYPVMKRLEQRQLVSSESGATGQRGHLRYRVTRRGRRAFIAWMTDAARVAGLGYDPLRTRLVFLRELDEAKRAAFHDIVGTALTSSPLAGGLEDVYLEELDKVWRWARRRAFEKVLAKLSSGSGPSRAK